MDAKKFESEARLTFGEATSIIVGHGVGSGILAIPYLASRNSVLDFVLLIIIAYCINLMLHLMIAELSYNNGGAQFVRCFELELFRGRMKAAATWLVFIFLGLSVMMNVSSFVTGAGAVLTSWFGLPLIVSELIFYAAAAAVVFVGMKAVGICEKAAVMSMGAVIAVLAAAVAVSGAQPLSQRFVSGGNVLALFSMISFALSAVMSTPQVVKGLNGDAGRVRGAIAAGTGINALIIVVITAATLLGAGADISENGALVDLSAHLGGWVGAVGYIFSLLALATSFWANTLNLRDVVNEQTGWGEKKSWAVASLPSLAVALLGVASFVALTRLASVIQVLTGLGIILAYNRSRKKTGESPIIGRFGALPFQLIVALSSVLATVGSLVAIS